MPFRMICPIVKERKKRPIEHLLEKQKKIKLKRQRIKCEVKRQAGRNAKIKVYKGKG